LLAPTFGFVLPEVVLSSSVGDVPAEEYPDTELQLEDVDWRPPSKGTIAVTLVRIVFGGMNSKLDSCTFAVEIFRVLAMSD
jgi:hypothetical protein